MADKVQLIMDSNGCIVRYNEVKRWDYEESVRPLSPQLEFGHATVSHAARLPTYYFAGHHFE